MNRQLFIIRFVLLLCGFMVFQEGKGYHVFEKDCMGAKFVLLIDEDDRSKARKEPPLPSRKGKDSTAVPEVTMRVQASLPGFPKAPERAKSSCCPRIFSRF